MKTRPTAPIGSRPTSEAANGAAAPDARRAAAKLGRRVVVAAAMPPGCASRPWRRNDSGSTESAILSGVIAYRFGREDLLHTRFAISPLFELQASVTALRDPGARSVHLPWVREARRRLEGFDYALIDLLVPDRGYAPDFFAPPPQTPLPDLGE